VAGRLADSLGLSEDEKNLVTSAAMLHDIGHSPYSHTLEMAVHQKMEKDHMQITKDIILGNKKIEMDGEEEPTIPLLLEKYGVNPEDVAELITGKIHNNDSTTIDDFHTHNNQMIFNDKMYLPHIIHGPIDSDQIDYLLRDSFYTGVAHGTIDIDRLIQTMEIFNNDLVVHKRGVPAVEGMLVARALMYTSVYYHKTVRIAELMMARAVELIEDPLKDLNEMVDSELMAKLNRHGGFQRDIASMLKYRRLFKRALTIQKGKSSDYEKEVINDLKDPRNRKRCEKELCTRAGIPQGYAIVDVPERELEITEPRIKSTNVKILDGTSLKQLSNYSPLAKALEVRDVYDWDIMVSAAPRYLTQVTKVAKKVLFE
jgi:HD superfamily phosphohydrolase